MDVTGQMMKSRKLAGTLQQVKPIVLQYGVAVLLELLNPALKTPRAAGLFASIMQTEAAIALFIEQSHGQLFLWPNSDTIYQQALLFTFPMWLV